MDAKTSSNNSPKVYCAVCGGESYGMHFGAESCRACAAFFRRTVALKLGYQCRTNGNCEIRKDFRCLCRFCRYKKCLEVGMKPENVQVNRFDPLPSVKMGPPSNASFENQTEMVSSSTYALSPSIQFLNPSKSEPDSSTSALAYELPKPTPLPPITLPLTPMPIPTSMPNALPSLASIFSMPFPGHEANSRESVIMNTALEAKAHMASIFNREVSNHQHTFMESMLTSYEKLTQKRNLFRLTMVNQQKSLNEIFNSLSTGPLQVINIERFDCNEHVTSCKFEALLFAEFCMELKYFSNLTIEQKFFIFKHCWRQLLMIDKAYETVQYLGYDEEDTRLIIYNVKAFNVRDVTCQDDDTKNMDVTEIHRYMYDFIVRPLKKLKPSLFEFLAMMGLFMWKFEGVTEVDPMIKKAGEEAKNEILQALHEYFVREKQQPAYALRLASIMELIAAVEKTIGQRIQEDMVLAQLFDVFNSDVFLSNLLD